MAEFREIVEAILYGSDAHRRFTQDGPVLPDVWTSFLEEAVSGGGQKRIKLLLEPHFDSTPALIADALRMRLGLSEYGRTKATYNRTVVSAQIRLRDLIYGVIPATRWYAELERERRTEREATPFLPNLLPRASQMWGRPTGTEDEVYPFPQLLSFVRIVGAIAFVGLHRSRSLRSRALTELESAVRHMRSGEQRVSRDAKHQIAEMAAEGWASFESRLPERYGRFAHGIRVSDIRAELFPIFNVNRNRDVKLALTHSVKTVKADAANRLFEVNCKQVTWAIIDSGIDATHPAFIDHEELDFDFPTDEVGRNRVLNDPLQRLRYSRVVETYNFAYLEDILRGKRAPERFDTEDIGLQKKAMQEITQRVRKSRMVDWELLKPLLRIQHDSSYVSKRPADGHGTHVAGIIGGDWHRTKDSRITGMCPNIRLVDIRVLRDDGTSNEFIIMSALQFLRYLNANVDRQKVHGANISLSLLHEAATYACGQTPVCEEAEHTVASGVVVVAAAGNLGYRRFTSPNSEPFDQYCPVSITDPGNAENVITVGSTHRIEPYSYGVSYFSSRGPTGDGRIKPDLVAPGEKIFAPTLEESAIRLDGTSMAAPHVSGAAAMLMARNVELMGDPARIKKVLCNSASDLGRERYFQGHGLLDVLRALQSI